MPGLDSPKPITVAEADFELGPSLLDLVDKPPKSQTAPSSRDASDAITSYEQFLKQRSESPLFGQPGRYRKFDIPPDLALPNDSKAATPGSTDAGRNADGIVPPGGPGVQPPGTQRPDSNVPPKEGPKDGPKEHRPFDPNDPLSDPLTLTDIWEGAKKKWNDLTPYKAEASALVVGGMGLRVTSRLIGKEAAPERIAMMHGRIAPFVSVPVAGAMGWNLKEDASKLVNAESFGSGVYRTGAVLADSLALAGSAMAWIPKYNKVAQLTMFGGMILRTGWAVGGHFAGQDW